MKKILVVIIWFIIADTYFAQQPNLRLDSLQSKTGDSVIVSLYADNLSNIGALTIKITIDTTVISWGRAMNWDNQLDGALAGFVNNQIILAWDGLNGMNLANGKLVELKLLYKGNTSSLVFDTTNTELANIEGNIIRVNFIDGSVSPLTDLDEPLNSSIPEDYSLLQNFPNPFNPTTIIKYAFPDERRVIVTVYNSLGQIVKTFNEGEKEAGTYKINFNGEGLSSGIYFYSINAVSMDGRQNFRGTKKMLLIK